MKALEVQPGKWDIRRIDIRDAKPEQKCMTQGDWDKTKARAIGKSPAPAGCQVTEVTVLAKMVRTTFSCKDKSIVEEIELAGASFRQVAFEKPQGAEKSKLVKQEVGRNVGPCDGKK